jgi:hypothetical protein
VTALQPAPPTPTTTILHGVRANDDDDDHADDVRFVVAINNLACFELCSLVQQEPVWMDVVKEDDVVVVGLFRRITNPWPTEANVNSIEIETRPIFVFFFYAAFENEKQRTGVRSCEPSVRHNGSRLRCADDARPPVIVDVGRADIGV